MSRPTLDERLAALREIAQLGEDRIPDALLADLEALLVRADGRRALSADHTVVGLFGATGSGKSSLTNALVGSEVARSHVRRPTTAEPLAIVWDPPGATALLDWLEVRDRRTGLPVIDTRATQLILLDLPDFDSVEASHRAVAERLAGQVDALVWVVDPQKYADAVLHADFIATHSRHGAVTLVVLNQIDLLPAAEVPRVVESLRGLLAADGLAGVRILTTSAATGEGVDALRAAIGDLANARLALTARLEADVAALAARVPGAEATAPAGGRSNREVTRAARDLSEQLGVAAGIDLVAGAVAGSYRKRSGQATGWPIVSWILRFRADPLARLGLKPTKRERDPEVHRTSMPAMNAGAQARVSLAVRGYAEAVAEPYAESWRAGIRETAQNAVDTLPPALDLAISKASLPMRGSWWWVPFGILQWLSIVSALVGVLWLLALAFLPRLGLEGPRVPEVEGWPVTTLLIAGGILLGVVLGIAGAAIGAAVGAHRRRRARKELLAQVAAVTSRLVVDPLAAEIDRARRFSAALERARS